MTDNTPYKLSSKEIIQLERTFGSHNYHPIPIVFSKGQGAIVWDPEGNEYIDFLSAYSAVNQGHCHPAIIATLKEQAESLTLSSRAFYNDKFGEFAKFITATFGYDMVLPMNTGAEAVETALKLARKWGYLKKGIPENEAIVLACKDNFHGRTLGVISMSSDPDSTRGFGPFLPNVGYQCPRTNETIRYNHVNDLKRALEIHGTRVAAFLVEPIQGEAGIIVPDKGYLRTCFELCRRHSVLFIADEIQTGLGRTEKLLACDHEGVKPDVLVLGKALSGGTYPVSAVLANKDTMLCIQPGEHGSTYGGNPLGAAVAMTALRVLQEEKLADRAETMGRLFRISLQQHANPIIQAVRGKGLLNALVLDESKMAGRSAWHLCLILKSRGVLAKPTHGHTIRFAPPLVISEQDLKRGIAIILKALDDIIHIPLDQIPDLDL